MEIYIYWSVFTSFILRINQSKVRSGSSSADGLEGVAASATTWGAELLVGVGNPPYTGSLAYHSEWCWGKNKTKLECQLQSWAHLLKTKK